MNMSNGRNANHIIIIDGHPFKANESGMWNLTDIWKVLDLSDNKLPSKWRNRKVESLKSKGQICLLQVGATTQTIGTKFATLQYAGWVSLEFSMMVYAAFESVLDMPEIAEVVANKMVELGYQAEAELLERHKDVYKEAVQAMNKISRRVDGRKPERIHKAVINGYLTKSQGLSMIPDNSVWYARTVAL